MIVHFAGSGGEPSGPSNSVLQVNTQSEPDCGEKEGEGAASATGKTHREKEMSRYSALRMAGGTPLPAWVLRDPTDATGLEIVGIAKRLA